MTTAPMLRCGQVTCSLDQFRAKKDGGRNLGREFEHFEP